MVFFILPLSLNQIQSLGLKMEAKKGEIRVEGRQYQNGAFSLEVNLPEIEQFLWFPSYKGHCPHHDEGT